MFEHRHQPLLPRPQFLMRLGQSAALALAVIAGSMALGILGYHYIAKLGWIDSFLNASMILSGMGPVDELHGRVAKIFAGCYALFSGIVFLSSAAIVVSPLLHRFLHRFHVPTDDDAGAVAGDKTVKR